MKIYKLVIVLDGEIIKKEVEADFIKSDIQSNRISFHKYRMTEDGKYIVPSMYIYTSDIIFSAPNDKTIIDKITDLKTI